MGAANPQSYKGPGRVNRREFLKSSAATAIGTAGAATAGFAAPAYIPRVHELALISPWPAAAGGYSDAVYRLARRIEQACGGRVKLHLTVGAASSITALSQASTALHAGLEHDNVAHHPAFGYFAGLPCGFGMPFAAHHTWLISGGGAALWTELGRNHAVMPLMAGHSGPMAGLWSVHPIKSLSDIASKSMFTRGLAADVAKGLGAATKCNVNVTIAADIENGLTGVAEWGSAAASLDAGLADVAKYCARDGFTPAGSTLSLTAGCHLWDRFDRDVQNAIRRAAGDEARRTAAVASENHALITRALTETKSVTFYNLPGDIQTAAQRISEAIVADVASRDDLSRRVNASYLDARRACNAGANKRTTGS
jgi:TRAP-type mannitol/chloroaromatic compound transport system substrate-binding protein